VVSKNITSNQYLAMPEKFNLNVEDLLLLPATLAVFWKNLDGHYLGCNDTPVKTLGLKSREDIINLSDYDLPILRKEAQAIRAGDAEVIRTLRPSQFHYKITANGKIFNLITSKAPLYNQDGELAGVYGIDTITSMNLQSALQGGIDTASFDLTNRQYDCLFYLAQGMTIKSIAKTLKLSPRTVEHYLECIKTKLNCHSRAELIRKALSSSTIQKRLKFDS
jgi:DNA-binding CsgD family transcriptional regulator